MDVFDGFVQVVDPPLYGFRLALALCGLLGDSLENVVVPRLTRRLGGV